MAKIRPFKSIRPQREKAASIAALPYDVYNRKEAAEYVAGHPESFLRIDRAETQFPLSVDLYDPQVYQKAHDLLWEAVGNGTFLQEDKPCYYIYEMTMGGRAQTGIVACASVGDYHDQVIKRHENTRAEKEEDRIRHVEACRAQTGPIFLAYRANQTLHALTAQAKEQEAEYDFVAEDGVRHRVFVIRDDDMIAQISAAFAQMDALYIADGHHRAASAVRVCERYRKKYPQNTGEEEFHYFLSVLFPDDELMIMDYNRVIRDLNGYSFQSFLHEVKARFDVTELTDEEEKRPKERGSFAMYLKGHWFLCRIRQEDRRPQDPVGDLDVSILQERLLAPVLGITEPKTDSRIDFVGGIRGIKELVRRCEEDCAVAFAMYPTAIGELFAVADAGLLMPPKSTWFEPKLRSGLFIHALEEI